MRFSPSTLGWYPEFVAYANAPADLVEVPEDIYRSLLGKQIEAGPYGMPRELMPMPAVKVPVRVTMRQARLALLEAKKLGLVDLAINSLPEGQREAAQIDWEFAATVDRDSPTTMVLAQSLGMSDDELDQLFTLAATF